MLSHSLVRGGSSEEKMYVIRDFVTGLLIFLIKVTITLSHATR